MRSNSSHPVPVCRVPVSDHQPDLNASFCNLNNFEPVHNESLSCQKPSFEDAFIAVAVKRGIGRSTLNDMLSVFTL